MHPTLRTHVVGFSTCQALFVPSCPIPFSGTSSYKRHTPCKNSHLPSHSPPSAHPLYPQHHPPNIRQVTPPAIPGTRARSCRCCSSTRPIISSELRMSSASDASSTSAVAPYGTAPWRAHGVTAPGWRPFELHSPGQLVQEGWENP